MRKLVMAAALAANGSSALAAEKPIYVLVHGAYQDGAAMTRLAWNLHQSGHDVITMTLAGRSGDARSVTFAGYRDQLLDRVRPYHRALVMVGFGSGGAVVTAAAAMEPRYVQKIVYIAGYVPRSGDTIFGLSALDKGKAINAKNWAMSADKTRGAIAAGQRVAILCGDCNAGEKAMVEKTNIAEPTAPFGESISYDANALAFIPRYYIRTADNRAISPAFQSRMAQWAGISHVMTIPGSHLSPLMHPERVADAIVSQ